jgi:hypothetical protein
MVLGDTFQTPADRVPCIRASNSFSSRTVSTSSDSSYSARHVRQIVGVGVNLDVMVEVIEIPRIVFHE